MVALYPHQFNNALRLSESIGECGAALDVSDTGTGKSLTALATADCLDKRAFVICPLSVGPGWEVKANEYNPALFLGWTNYEKARKPGWLATTSLVPESTLIVFDEAHRVKGKKTQQAELVRQLKQAGFDILFLSATPFVSPLETRAMAYAHNLTTWIGWWRELPRFGCRRAAHLRGNPWVWTPSITKMHKLREWFGKSLVHTGWKDVEGFGDLRFVPELVELSPSKRSALNRARAGLDWDNPGAHVKERVLIESVRAKAMAEQAKDLVETSHWVLAFFNFLEPLDEFATLAGTERVIKGSTDGPIREEHLNNWRKEGGILAAQSATMCEGVDCHDTDGDKPRVSLVSLPWSATVYRQLMGRTHRAGQKSPAIFKPFFVKDTPEQTRLLPNLTTKMENLATLRDADFY